MHKENSIVIQVPRMRIFETASDLSLWPRILPHYRWVHYLEKSPRKNLVVMAAKRGWIPITWTSEEEIDPERMEVRFHHLKAFTKGMDVVWSFRESEGGVLVTISHELKPTIPIVGRFVAERIIGDFFIHYVANETLKHMKIYLEANSSLKPIAGDQRVG